MAQQIRYGIGFDVKKDGLQQVKKSLKQLQNLTSKDLLNLNKSLDAKDASQTLMNIKRQAVAVEDALRNAFNTKLNTVNIQSFNQSLEGSKTTLQKVYDTFSQAGVAGQNAFRDLSTQVLNTNIQLKESHTVLDKMATTLANTVKWNIASSAVNSLTRSVQQAWGFVKSLDTSLNDIRIVTGKSSEEMGKFAEQANAAAESLGRTTTDYTKAALIYAQQGLDDEEIAKRSQITLKTANVTGQSTDAVSEELTAVWNGYKVNAEQAEVYVDRLAAVAATTASDLEELSTGMSKVASAANAMGVSEEQLAAQLSTIISATRQAPESVGTALRTVYARISDIKAGIDEDGVDLGNYSGKMAELGFNVLDVNGNLRDMGTVMEEIGNQWSNLTREQQVSLAQTMAGQRQYSNLIALFDNFQQYNKALNTAQNAAGTLQKQQDIYMESTRAHLEQLTAAVEDIYKSLIDNDSINSLVDGLTTAANLVGIFVDSIGGGGSILRSLGAIGITVFSEQIAKGISTTITNFEIAKQNAQQFKDTLNAIQEWRGIEGLDKTTDQLLQNRQQLGELAKSMTPEQFSGMQTLLNNMNQLGNEIKTIQDKIEPAQNALKAFTETPLQKILGDGKEIDKISEQINDPIDDLDKLQQKIKQTKESFRDDLGSATTLFEKTNVEEFDQAFGEAQGKVTSFLDSLKDIKNTPAFKGLGEKLNEELGGKIDDLENRWKDLSVKFNEGINFKNSGAMAQELKTFFNELSQITGQSSQEIRDKYEHLISSLGSPEDILRLEQKKAQLNKMISNFTSGVTRAENTQKIENYAKMAGGIAQVGSAIRQVQNLGSIWKNQDLTTGEKLLRTVTNLAMSLPMLINGFRTATTAMGLMQIVEKEEFAASSLATASEIGHVGAIKLLGGQAEKTVLKVELLNKTILLNPYVAAGAALMAFIGILMAYKDSQEEARKATIETDKEIIQQSQEIQNELDKRRDLYSELDSLNQDQNLSRGELKSSIQDLIEQYGLEDQAAQKLIDSYGNLSDALKNLRYEDAKKRSQAAKNELDAARELAQKTTEDNQRGKGFSASNLDGRYTVNFGVNTDIEKQNTETIEALKKAGGIFNNQTGNFSFFANGKSEEDMLAQYQAIEKIYDNLNQSLSSVEKQNDITFQGMGTYLKQNKEWADELANSLEKVKKANIEEKGQKAIQNGTLNFDNITNLEQYITQFEKLKKVVGSTDNAQAFISSYQNQLYKKFGNLGSIIDKTGLKLQDLNEKTKKEINNLNEDQLAAAIKINPEDISSWETFLQLLKQIQQTDVSKTAEGVINSNQAIDDYLKYNNLEKKVKKGETFSTEEYDALDEDLKKHFEYAGDGLYKFSGKLQDFTKDINGLKFDSFHSNFGNLVNQLKSMEKLQKEIFENTPGSKGINSAKDLEQWNNQKSNYYNKIDQDAGAMAGTERYGHQNNVNYEEQKQSQRELIDNQLDYLEALGKTTQQLGFSVNNFRNLNQTSDLSVGQIHRIYQAVHETGDQTDQLVQKSKEANDALSDALKNYFDLLDPLDEDIDPEQFTKLTDEIQNGSEKFGKFVEGFEEMENAHQTAQDMAQGMLRFDNAIEDANEHFDEWVDSSKDLSEHTEDLKDTYQDILDVDGDVLSDDFAQDAENLDLMRQALSGNLDAYNDLVDAAQEDLWENVLNLEPDTAGFEKIQGAYQDMKRTLEDNPVDLGDTISFDTQGTYATVGDYFQQVGQAAYDNAIATGSSTADAFDAAMAAQFAAGQEIGYIPQFDNSVVQNNDTENMVDWVSNVEPVPLNTSIPQVTGVPIGNNIFAQATGAVTNAVGSIDSVIQETRDASATVSKNTSGTGVRLRPVAGKNLGGGAPKINNSKKTFTNNGGGGGSKGKGKKGGGGKKGGKKGSSSKKNEPDKTQKDPQKKLKDERDIYHDINIQIDKINRTLDRTQKKQDRLYGKQLIKNLNEQTKILEKHKKKLEEKNKLQQKDLKNQRKALKNLGVTFNKYGDISNYMSVLGKKQKEVNNLVDKQNKLIKQYNAETDKEKKQKINEQIEKIGKQKSTKEEDYKDLKDRIKNYDELREQIEDIKDQIEEETQKQIEIKIEKFNMKIKIRLEMGEAERDWNKFKRDVLDHTDILKDSDFSKNLKDAQLNYADARSYFRTQYKDKTGKTVTMPGTIQGLTSQLRSTQREFNIMDEGGKSSIYGDNKKQAIEDMETYLKDLMGQMQDYESLIDDIDEAYLDTIDTVSDFFDKQIDDYNFVSDLISHDMDLLTLLYGDKNYKAMDGYYTQLQNNNLKQIDSLRKQKDFWEREWKEAAARGDTNAAQKFKENYKKVLGDLNSAVEDAAKTIQDKYTNAINGIFDQLDKKMTKGQGSDYLNMEWDLMKKNGEQYLDTINSAFAIQQTQRKYQKAVDDTKSIKSQKELKKLMNDQLNILKNKQKLTQYDIDRAQKLLQVEQARIALEDARSAKTSMQLKRDSQGNYSYEYVADNDMVEEAESGYANALNDLYNFDLDRYKGNLEEMLSAWEEFQEKYKEIQLDVSLTDEERIQRLKLLEEQYGEYINGKTQENLVIRNNLKESAFKDMEYLYDEDVAKFQNMSDSEQEILMKQLVPQWSAGIEQMALKFSGEGGFIPACEEAFKKTREATKDYQGELDRLADVAGTDFGSLKDGVSEAANEYSPLIENNNTLISQMETELTNIEDLKEAVHNLSLEYKAVYDQATAAVTAITNLIKTQKAQAAAEAQRKKAEEDAKKKKAQQKAGKVNIDGKIGIISRDNYAGMLSKQLNDLKSSSSKSQFKKDEKNSGNKYQFGAISVDEALASGTRALSGTSRNLVMGLAGSILLSNKDNWGNGETRLNNFIKVFGQQLGNSLNKEVSDYLASNVVNNKKYLQDIVDNHNWYSSFDMKNFKQKASFYLKNASEWKKYDTGGYTGVWNSSEGRPAILHEKELVLNKQDTKNILNSVTIMRSIMASMSGNIISKLGSLTSINSTTSSFGNNSMLQQQVKIQATFPNVNSKKEIEEALNDLVNLAAQRAMR